MEAKMKVSDMKKTRNNPRKGADLKKLRDNMEEYGDLSGVVFNRKLDELVSGNQRTDILKNGEFVDVVEVEGRNDGTVREGFILWEGLRFVYREVEWGEEKHRRAVIVANTHAGLWDKRELKAHWGDLNLKELGVLEMNKKSLDEGDIRFSTELDEASNYVVLKFDKDIDWLNFLSLVGIESTYSRRQNGKEWDKGMGRVLDGISVINKLKK